MEEAGEEPGTIMDLWLGVLPFILGQAIVIALLVIFPGLALWLPNLVKGRQ
jgi:TRAP-type mannitol/chloroaromatic compound transport system permease large subunit